MRVETARRIEELDRDQCLDLLRRVPVGRMAFVEAGDDPTDEGWSVVVHGGLLPETDPDRLGRLSGRLDSWAPGVKDRWLRLPATSVQGRRLVGTEVVVELPDSPRPRWREPAGWVPATRTPAQYATDFDGR